MIRAAAYLAALIVASPAAALTLADCERTTHISHAGEAGHRDFGAGRVGYGEWWSQEGTYLDLVVADCKTDAMLRTRVQEERISARAPFDRTDDAVAVIEREMAASPSLFRCREDQRACFLARGGLVSWSLYFL